MEKQLLNSVESQPLCWLFFYTEVTATFAQQHTHTLNITIDGETIETTDEHPFLNANGVWVNAQDLQVGNEIVSADGDVGVVEAIERIDEPQMMYNLSVAVVATYLVGDGKWVVHNVQIGPFDITGNTLFLGEGDFSFSRSIVEQLPSSQAQQVVSTDWWTEALAPKNDMARYLTYLDNIETLDAMGARVLPGIDATDLLRRFPNNRFDTIIWNFPHTGGGVRSNQRILSGFFNNVVKALSSIGQVQISLSSSSFYNRFGVKGLAQRHFDSVSFETITPYSEFSKHFPGYVHTTTTGHAQPTNIPGTRVWTCKS